MKAFDAFEPDQRADCFAFPESRDEISATSVGDRITIHVG
jgi:hypothetical protein